MGTIRVHEFMSLDGVIDAPAERQREKINGHVRVCTLFDSHDIQTPV
jgi:hypothetical protein